MSHLLDANCFMESKDRFYRFAVCPGYWDWLVPANRVDVELLVRDARLTEEGHGQQDYLRVDGRIGRAERLDPELLVLAVPALLAPLVSEILPDVKELELWIFGE